MNISTNRLHCYYRNNPTYTYQPQHGFVFPPSQGQWQPSGIQAGLRFPEFPSSSMTSLSMPSTSAAPTSSSEPSQSHSQQSKAKSKPSKQRSKSLDWSEDETKELIDIWGARYEKLRRASNKEKTKLWNEIYVNFQKRYSKNERTLPQVKKRVQNLEYEYKNAKQKSQSTGEEGMNYIKEKFPFFDQMDVIVGHRDIADVRNMELESSTLFDDSPSSLSETSDSSRSTTPHCAETTDKEVEEVGTPVSSKGKGRKVEKGKKGKKRKIEDSDDEEWHEKFFKVMEKGMEEDNKRFEKCMKAFQESQTKQMEQTNNILTGFQGIFKDLLSKKD